MIPTIGVMIGAYIFTRMIDMLAQPGTKWPAALSGMVTMVLVVIGIAALLLGSASLPPLLPGLIGRP